MVPNALIHETARNDSPTSRLSGWWVSYRSRLTPYLFIAPNLVLFSIFIFFPLFFAAYISVHEWSLIDTPLYLGAQNYTRLLTDYQFWQAMKNTVLYSVATVPTSLALGLVSRHRTQSQTVCPHASAKRLLSACCSLERRYGNHRRLAVQRPLWRHQCAL